MDMISNEILRDRNIKRTFMGVDKVQSFPVDLVKLSLKYELDKSKLQEIDRGTQKDLREMVYHPNPTPKHTAHRRLLRFFSGILGIRF